MIKRILTFIYVSCFTAICSAQVLTVKNATLLPDDKTALLSPCLDSNGDTCAVIKIKVPGIEGLDFSNKSQYVKSSYVDGIYIIYVPTISRRLDYKHSDFLPGQIDLGDYGFKKLKAGKTYLVQMEAPSNAKNGSFLVLKVNPISSRVSLNGSQVDLSSNGIYEFTLREGTYSYSVVMDDYLPLNGTIQVSNDENKTIALNLKPITHAVKVTSNVGKAHVYVDNVDYGETGKLDLPQGKHHIRIQKEGYIDAEEDVDIQNNTTSLSYSLKKNKNLKEIHATSVRIFSKATKVYKNNKEIRDWKKSGDVVLIMPGEYILSDNLLNDKRIVVGADAMDVFLGDAEASP